MINTTKGDIMIDRLALLFARFALRVVSTRFSKAHRRVWSVRVDPWLIGDDSPGAAELALYFGDPELARKGLDPVFRMVFTDEMLDTLVAHAQTARRMRNSMRRG